MKAQKRLTSKDKDKFYTNPKVVTAFLENIDRAIPLSSFDRIIEPSAGNGKFLDQLPANAEGYDLYPERDDIKQQDFLQLNIESGTLFDDASKILVVGNPPFGTGYMNPLARDFFNHAAQFAHTIAFIIPASWDSSWKIHRQLDPHFGLYFSEVLPEKSFLLDDKPYNVNCCMQIWSKQSLGTNIRIMQRPPTSHEDFDMFLTCDGVARRNEVREQLTNREYWEFGIKYWGDIRIDEIDTIDPMTTTHFVIKANKPYVRKVFESIDWDQYMRYMGARHIGSKATLVQAYTDAVKKVHITS